MTYPAEEQITAREEFKRISDILAVPTEGSPLVDKRRWKLPCPDSKALADYPPPEEKRERWLREWTSCNNLATGSQQPTQPSKVK